MSNRFLSKGQNGGGLLLIITASSLTACGGSGTSGSTATAAAATVATATVSLQAELPAQTAAVDSQQVATPLFHVAPVILDEPEDTDSIDSTASANIYPHLQTVQPQFAGLSTRRLTAQKLALVDREGIAAAGDDASGGTDSAGGDATPMSSGTVVATYTPAQIRAAYGLPALPSTTSGITSAQAAQLGAGQTIYIIDAQNDPNVVSELTSFNSKFGLPTCSTLSIATTASRPLAAASTTAGCQFAVVYATTSGSITTTAPSYNSGWATEIALDVQWAHATAPLARIILIEAPDSSSTSLLSAISLANSMGPGIVSMSFGSAEGNWTASLDSSFTAANMTYLAAAGDSGAAVQWPAVSTHVVAVGGTTLTYNGGSSRSEVAWSGTGGGVSQYTATPSYQTSAVPGMGSLTHRAVTDVSFNADPTTGQYLAVISQGSSSVSWLSAGGTSLATPQWAGIIATANAIRAQNGKAALGAPHSLLYQTISTVAGTYASAFADITSGSDGTCTSCYAKTGYDLPTGLGTPKADSLLGALTGTSTTTTAAAPTVSSASVSGTAGTALSFTVTVSAQHSVTYSLSNAPSGMSISASGVVSWASPVSGTYPVTVNATDSSTGLSGHGTYTVTITSPPAPTVSSSTIKGTAGTALTFTVSVTHVNPVTYSLSGAPSGMTINSAGVVSWSAPVAGNYSVTAIAQDTKTGLSGRGTYTVQISAPSAPTVSVGSVTGHTGTALSFAVQVSDPNPVSYALSANPSGMTISSAGVVTWASPVAGSYSVAVTVTDTKTRLATRVSIPVSITTITNGPSIAAANLTGTAGHALSGAITLSDSSSTSLSVSVSGVPSGMTVSMSGATLSLHWNSPVTGNYSIGVTARDSKGFTASRSIAMTITAH